MIVESVVENGPADEAGIKGATGEATSAVRRSRPGGDIITKVDGKEVDRAWRR